MRSAAQPRTTRQVRALSATVAGVAVLGLAAPALAGPTAPATRVERNSFTNPVSAPFADTFADPSVIRGRDGAWYAYGTSDPLREGEKTPHRIPIARSDDLVSWTHVGDAFTSATLPTWADRDPDNDPSTTATASLWAPDVRYVDGEYRMYYVVTDTTVTAQKNDNAIGMATAPTPAGPWTDSGAPVVAPRPAPSGKPDDFLWTFDPSAVTDTKGRQWIFYGSYYGGIYASRLNADGTQAVGKATQVAIDNKFEGAYPVRHGGYWYLFASTANCCAGPTTGYSVQVGRSRSIAGPYVDQTGVKLTASRAGGTPTLVQNGNRWVGAGHNAVVTDLAGQDWMVYHAIDRADPYLDGTDGVNERPMLMDRLDWVNGWPAVRAGRGPSTSQQSGPATGGRTVTDFATGIPTTFATTGRWNDSADVADDQSGRLARSTAAGTLRATGAGGRSVRVQADLRTPRAHVGLLARVGRSTVKAVLDPSGDALILTRTRRGRVLSSDRAPLPADSTATWHTVSLEVRAGRAVARVSSSGLAEPVAVADLTVPRGGTVRAGGVIAGSAGADVDNLSVLPAATPVTRLAADQVPDRLVPSRSDEFSGGAPAAGWTWVRRDDKAEVADGRLQWPTEAADLTGTSNDAGLLLRNPGTGSWTAQTKVSIDLGTETIRNYQQAGLIAYVDDDEFARLDVVSIYNTRQVEFGHETTYAGRLAYGGTIVGPPATTTWLRLTHRIDPRNGEHELRGWTSRDGRRWVKGGVWTLPAKADVRVGLVSHGGAGATARFDYFRLYR